MGVSYQDNGVILLSKGMFVLVISNFNRFLSNRLLLYLAIFLDFVHLKVGSFLTGKEGKYKLSGFFGNKYQGKGNVVYTFNINKT